MLHEHLHSGIDLAERNACHVTAQATLNLSVMEEKRTIYRFKLQLLTCLQVLSGTPEDY